MLYLLIFFPGMAMGLAGQNSSYSVLEICVIGSDQTQSCEKFPVDDVVNCQNNSLLEVCIGCDQARGQYPVGDVRNCRLSEGMMKFEVNTGFGWDNILNKGMRKVLQLNYSQCLMSEDGKYLIPDDTFLIPVKRSDVNNYAEYFDHWANYTDITANSINVEASIGGIFGVSGSFSQPHEMIKSHMVQDQSKALRVQLRYHRYTMKTDSRSPLDPTFQNRVLEVAAHIQSNDTDVARYLSDLIVRDYGTHYITSVDAGGVLSKVDTVRNRYINEFSGDLRTVKTSASISLFSLMKVGFDDQHLTDQEQQTAYQENCVFSHVQVYGGPMFGGNLSVDEWVHGLENSLVAIDRSGEPLHQTITADNFPDLSEPVLIDVSEMIEKSITHYYQFNTYPGCTDPNKSNFVFSANVDDGTCVVPPTNFTFGGSFQKCVSYSSYAGGLCQYYSQKNPLTNNFSCPSGYNDVQVYTDSVVSAPVSKCESCGFLWLWTCCKEHRSRASYQAYWCAATGPVDERSGYMFGGFYSTMPKVLNPLTKDTSCPVTYYPIIFLGRYMYICISDDYELGYIHSVPFAGVYSCMFGNPLSSDQPTGATIKNTSLEMYFASEDNPWPKQCPEDYSQHLLSVEGGCAVNYCVQSGSLSPPDQLPTIHRPPFTRRPHSKVSAQQGAAGDDSAEAHRVPSKVTIISSGTAAGIAIVATLMMIVIIYGIIQGFSRRNGKQKTSKGKQKTSKGKQKTQDKELLLDDDVCIDETIIGRVD